jgi:protein tyrosine phosphatase (PTP) superfamily phosphohydrolase (DUF442 family)/cytochrome c556
MPRLLPVLVLPLAFAACATGAPGEPETQVPPPMPFVENAYEAAASLKLAGARAMELPGHHNVFRLSQNLVSGGEPHGEEAFVELAKMGIRTILSVDGAVPNREAAARHGMRYVHVPVQYKGLTDDEVLKIAKTFRELPGPFFVHCFHGKHRGPAAAAIGRCVIDGASRQQAIAEMRQWMGTAPEYEGLYRTIASQHIPSRRETAMFAFDFPAEHRAEGFQAAMVEITRAFDHLKDLDKRQFAADPAHPDVDALNEARKLQKLFEVCMDTPEQKSGKDDFQRWLRESLDDSRSLTRALERGRAGAGDALIEASNLVGRLQKTCKACHKSYRDD